MSLLAAWLGRVGYLDGWRLQEAVATRVREGDDERLEMSGILESDLRQVLKQ